jgi:hypothetical protein
LPRRPTAVAIIGLILECIASSATALIAIERVREFPGLKASTAADDNTPIPKLSKAHAVVRRAEMPAAAREAEVGAGGCRIIGEGKNTSNFN